MGRHDRHVDRLARAEREDGAAGQQVVAPGQLSAAAGVVGLVHRVGREGRIAGGELGHHLGPAHLEQHVMLGVEVVGRDAEGRADEDVGLRLEHGAGARLDLRGQLGQQIGQQRGVGGVALDVLEHRPAGAALDPADGLADRQAGGGGLAVDTQRLVGGVVLDRRGGERLGQLGQRLALQQRVLVQGVGEEMRNLGVCSGEGLARGGREHGHLRNSARTS